MPQRSGRLHCLALWLTRVNSTFIIARSGRHRQAIHRLRSVWPGAVARPALGTPFFREVASVSGNSDSLYPTRLQRVVVCAQPGLVTRVKRASLCFHCSPPPAATVRGAVWAAITSRTGCVRPVSDPRLSPIFCIRATSVGVRSGDSGALRPCSQRPASGHALRYLR
jgi:hypothetical protein